MPDQGDTMLQPAREQLPDALWARRAAVLWAAGTRAFPAGEYVGQESFVGAREALDLAYAGGLSDGTTVLDLCCGGGALGLHLAQQTNCRLMGIDHARDAILLARENASSRGMADRAAFLVADVPRLPLGVQFDTVLLFETFLAMRDKLSVLAEIRRLLRPGGRLSLTLEAGPPLSRSERESMPDGHTVWLLSHDAFVALLEEAGFRLRHGTDRTAAHAEVARRLAAVFEDERTAITAGLGAVAWQEMVTAHQLWAEWLEGGRVQKLALVAEARTS